MPIGSTVVYNPGDLILHNVSSSGNTFQEVKIAAATSSIILFNSNGLISSQSLNSTTVGTASSLVAANSYTASNLQVTSTLLVGSISASSFIIAPSFTGSLAGTSSWATNALTAALATSINFTASNSTTSQTASYLTTTNSYTVANLTASNISASGTGSFGCVGIGTTSPGSKLEVSGQISVAAGSEPSPAYAFASDLDTGFYRPAADQLRIVTGGASRASFTSTEIRVGNNLSNLDIGAESKFIIVGSENTPTLNTLIASLGFSNASNQAGQTSDEIAKILVTCQDATTNQGRLEFQTKDGTNLLTRMMIDKNGNVGVGTSSPNTLLNVGSGTPSTAANGIQFGSDTSANLYRISTGVIKTDGGLTVGGTTTTVNALSASGINVNGNVRASSFTGSVFGTSSWSTNALTASFVTLAQSASYYGGSVTSASYALSSSFATNAANAFIQNGNSFGATATIGTNDANSLVLETNNTAQLTINSGGRIGIGVGVDPACKLNISDTHVGSLGSASIFISTTQTQNTANSNNDTGIYNAYVVSNFTSSTSVQNQSIYNTIQINGSGSFSGSYRAARHGVLLSNSASLETNSFLANTYLTNQISPGIPNFNIPNWYLGTYIYSDLITGNTTGSIGSTYGHYLGTPFSTGAGGITVTSSYGIYIERQKTANVVTNGYGIYQNYTGDLNIFAGKTCIGSTTAPINTLDVTGNISASTITASLFFGTSSVANALNTANSYQIANLTASNISASTITASNVIVNGNLTVTGSIFASLFSASNIYITSSTLVVTDNIITINALSPYQRYAGLEMYDSGSGTLSSFLWDSINNYFFVSSSDAGASRQIILGPTGESSLTANYIPLISGSNNITSSVIYQSGSNVGIGTTTPLSKFVVNGGTVNTSSYTTSEARIADGSIHLMKTVAGGVFESIRAMNMDTTAGTTVRVLAASTSDPFNNANGGKVFIDAIRTSTNMDLAFSLNDVAGAAAVERVRFMGSGNVGIGSTSPVNKLDVVGNISCSVITASLFFGTASVSNALNSANSYQVTNLTTSGDIIYGNAVLLDYSSSVLATSQSNYVVLKNLTGSYNGAFFDYFASSASNFRAGTVIAGWSGSNITYTEYATTDVGGTNQLTMSAAISASYIQLLGNAASSLNWNIKSSGRYL